MSVPPFEITPVYALGGEPSTPSLAATCAYSTARVSVAIAGVSR